jgi:hypothetical protein
MTNRTTIEEFDRIREERDMYAMMTADAVLEGNHERAKRYAEQYRQENERLYAIRTEWNETNP